MKQATEMTAASLMRRWPLAAACAAIVMICLQARAANNAATNAIVEDRMRRDITFLASDECEGRGIDTKGINLAADYIAREFKKAGLKPIVAGNPGYFQPFTTAGNARLESPNTLSLRGPLGQTIELKLGVDFQAVGMSAAGKVTAPIVFAGYGATAKEIGYDDFQGIDVAGKIVVILRKTPRADNAAVPFDGEKSAHHAALATKMVNADLHKAAAILFVNDRDTARSGDTLMAFSYTATATDGGQLMAVHVRRSVIDPLVQASLGGTLLDIERDIDRDLKPRSTPLAGWTASLEVNVKRNTLALKNVVGVLEGKGPLAKETVVIGAHYDHLGFGTFGSLARDKKPAIHHGADDNGSGTTVLMELARRFSEIPNREGRRLVFIAFSGEERGLLGSAHYCKSPLLPLADTVAMVNLDMVGRLREDKDDKNKDQLQVHGTGTAKTFDLLIEKVNERHGFKLRKIPGGFGPSDHASFYGKQVPVYFFFTGDHPDYHKPSDTAEKINVTGMRRVAALVEDVIVHLAAAPDRPEYVKVSGGTPSRGPKGPTIGIRPAYGDDKPGVLVEGVLDGRPAAKAGLKDGDRIVELAGKPVKDLQSYMVLMATQKTGQPVEFVVLRDGKKIALKVTPE